MTRDPYHEDQELGDSSPIGREDEDLGSRTRADAPIQNRSTARRSWPRFGAMWKRNRHRLPKFKRGPVMALSIALGAVAFVALLSYLLIGRLKSSDDQSPHKAVTNIQTPASPAADDGLSNLFGAHSATDQEPSGWLVTAASITLKLALSGLLAALLAFRPHKDLPILQRNPYVAQTQILLAVVAAALMMIVADNAARAFGIFAAASLVRFRTNIRDPKEITILLMSLAIGLACGVGKIEVSIILSLFSLLVLSVLEYYEPQEIFRAMELTVTSRKVEETDQLLRDVFDRRNLVTELRKVDREDPENPLGKIVYHVNVNGHLSTDQLSDEIFASDPDNVDSIQWDQKKTSSYIYR